MDCWYDVISIIRKVFTGFNGNISELKDLFDFYLNLPNNGDVGSVICVLMLNALNACGVSHWLHYDHAGIFEMIIFTEQHVHLFLYYDVRCSQMNTIWRMAWKPWSMPLSLIHECIVFNGFHSTIPAIVHEFNNHECNARMVSVEWFQCRDSNPDLHAFGMACCHWHHMTFSIGHVINDSIWTNNEQHTFTGQNACWHTIMIENNNCKPVHPVGMFAILTMIRTGNTVLMIPMRAWLLWNDSLVMSSFRSSLQWFSFSVKDMRSCNHMELWQCLMRTCTRNRLTRFRDRSILIISLAPVYMVSFQWFRFILASFIIKMITLFTILTHSINMK